MTFLHSLGKFQRLMVVHQSLATRRASTIKVTQPNLVIRTSPVPPSPPGPAQAPNHALFLSPTSLLHPSTLKSVTPSASERLPPMPSAPVPSLLTPPVFQMARSSTNASNGSNAPISQLILHKMLHLPAGTK